MAFELRMIEGGAAGSEQRFAFAHKIVRIGRSSSNDLVVHDGGASRAHCEIVEDGETYTLRDLGSSNGTKVNDRVATECKLRDGDRIAIGKMTFEFKRSAGKSGGLPRSHEAGRPLTGSRKGLSMKTTEGIAGLDLSLPSHSKTPILPRQKKKRGAGAELWASWRSASPKARRGVMLGTGVAALLVTASGVWMSRRPLPDRSHEIFAADERNAALRFGAGRVDVSTPDKASFQFVHAGGHVQVTYAIGGIEARDEVAIVLNGERVSQAPLSPNAWTTGVALDLPRKALRLGANILTFDNTQTPAREERWGVSQVTITEEPLPPPDPKRAQQLYDLGKTAYEARSVTPPNLWRATEYLSEGRSYLEALIDPPPLYQQLVKLEDKAKAELQAIFDAHMFAAEKAGRFGDHEQAAQVLRELLRYFPETSDPRHAQAKSRLSELGRAVQ